MKHFIKITTISAAIIGASLISSTALAERSSELGSGYVDKHGDYISAPAENYSRGDWYVSGLAGLSFVPKHSFTNTNAVTGSVNSKSGFNLGAALGYRFSNNLRAEAAIDYIDNSSKNFSIAGTSIASSGDIKVSTYMANLLYDFDTQSAFTPYVGIGAGYAKVKYNITATTGPAGATNSSNVFAYQGIVGLGYDVSENVRLNLDYKYLRTASGSYTLTTPAGVSGSYRRKYSAHRISLGATYFF
jgi:opacity protein-like surface antigen